MGFPLHVTMPPLTAVQYVMCSGFVDDVMFSHNGANGPELKTMHVSSSSPCDATGGEDVVYDFRLVTNELIIVMLKIENVASGPLNKVTSVRYACKLVSYTDLLEKSVKIGKMSAVHPLSIQ